MTRPYSEDLRERVLAQFAAGETIRTIGEALGIDPSCVPNERSGSRGRVRLLQRRFDGRKPRALSADISLWLCERLRSGPFTAWS
jgi:transposase